jgi:hypothetical protein
VLGRIRGGEPAIRRAPAMREASEKRRVRRDHPASGAALRYHQARDHSQGVWPPDLTSNLLPEPDIDVQAAQ